MSESFLAKVPSGDGGNIVRRLQSTSGLARAARVCSLLDDYVSWLQAYGVSSSSVSLYVHHLARLSETCHLPEATSDELVAWLQRPGWKPNTRRSVRNAMKSYYGWLHRSGRRADDPTSTLRTVRVPPQVPVVAEIEGIEAALRNASPQDHLALSLAAFAGLRRAEIAGLHASDIFPDVIHVRGKGGKGRKVPIHDRLREPLLAAQARGGYIFPGRNGWEPITPAALGKRMTRAMDGLTTPHALRRSFATRVYRGSRDVRAVQVLLGHSSLATTSLYLGADDDQLRSAVASL